MELVNRSPMSSFPTSVRSGYDVAELHQLLGAQFFLYPKTASIATGECPLCRRQQIWDISLMSLVILIEHARVQTSVSLSYNLSRAVKSIYIHFGLSVGLQRVISSKPRSVLPSPELRSSSLCSLLFV